MVVVQLLTSYFVIIKGRTDHFRSVLTVENHNDQVNFNISLTNILDGLRGPK